MFKIPKAIWSARGSVPITYENAPDGPNFGQYDPGNRIIRLNTASSPDKRLHTFFHEMGHVAIMDNGGHYILKNKQHEFVCEMFANYLEGMAKAGLLTIKAPPTDE